MNAKLNSWRWTYDRKNIHNKWNLEDEPAAAVATPGKPIDLKGKIASLDITVSIEWNRLFFLFFSFTVRMLHALRERWTLAMIFSENDRFHARYNFSNISHGLAMSFARTTQKQNNFFTSFSLVIFGLAMGRGATQIQSLSWPCSAVNPPTHAKDLSILPPDWPIFRRLGCSTVLGLAEWIALRRSTRAEREWNEWEREGTRGSPLNP